MIWLLEGKPLKSQTLENGVLTKKVGNSYIFIFPSTQGRISATSRPAGKIEIGNTITIKYAFEVIGGHSRFILIDATNSNGINPKLTVEQVEKLFGFLVKDLHNSQLDIYIDPSFMARVPVQTKEAIQKEMVRHGNLDVVIVKGDTGYRIKEVRLN